MDMVNGWLIALARALRASALRSKRKLKQWLILRLRRWDNSRDDGTKWRAKVNVQSKVRPP